MQDCNSRVGIKAKRQPAPFPPRSKSHHARKNPIRNFGDFYGILKRPRRASRSISALCRAVSL